MFSRALNSLSCIACVCIGLAAARAGAQGADRKALFGELHVHTAWSFDAYLFATRATPDDAYEFAKGKPLKHVSGKTFRLSRPLDFMAVTDHGIFLGVLAKMADPTHELFKHPIAEKVNSPDRDVVLSAFFEVARSSPEDLKAPQILREVWDEIIASANRHYEPGKFTTFIGYEWTSTPDGQNLHRNVIFKGDTAPPPLTARDSPNPEDLWKWMDEIRALGHEALAIPHNSNLSDGRMFEREDSWDNSFTADYAATRNRNEPLVEVLQIKGNSETHPLLSPNDEFADFEIVEKRVASDVRITQHKGSYVRDALRGGLEFRDTVGFNPYRFGLVAASDSHTGISQIEEDNYAGESGWRDSTPELRLGPDANPYFRFHSAAGLAGVWAEENTRQSIYDAMRRKETWGTSGPRIQVRFFGAFDMAGADPAQPGWVEAAYENGVPMGGALVAAEAQGRAPTFVVWAVKDVEGANLDRVQIVKGWADGGNSYEKVYDALWSGDRVPDPETGKVPAVGNTVDVETLEYSNTIGAVELSGVWTDPDFAPEKNAFYYVRVLEIPTPRWSMFDAKELGIDYPPELKKTIQERAFTSPIWYDHH